METLLAGVPEICPGPGEIGMTRQLRIRRQRLWCQALGVWFVLRQQTKAQGQAWIAALNAAFGPKPKAKPAPQEEARQ